MGLQDLVDAWKGKRVLVIGDVMLDHYVYGDVERVSPEAPVPVLRQREEKFIPGGAANVAQAAAMLGANCLVMGVQGLDVEGGMLGRKLRCDVGEGHLDHRLAVEKGRMTTSKLRYIARGQQLLRVDNEQTEKIEDSTEQSLVQGIIAGEFDVAFVSDYGKGVVTPRLMGALRSHIGKVVLDPKPSNKEAYDKVTLIKPNLGEAYELAGRRGDPKRIAADLQRKYGGSVVITMGAQGMLVYGSASEQQVLETVAREVYDVTGAGDVAGAVFALGIACGARLGDIAKVANAAAGLSVAHVGNYTPSVKELKDALSSI